MTSFDYGQLRARARSALDAQHGSAKNMIMLHSGVVIGLGLLISVISYVLNMGIDQTSGLSGIGTRATLESLQSVLEIVNMVLLPFWTMGYVFGILGIVREDRMDCNCLLWGFRNWGVILRSLFLRALIYLLLLLVSTQVAGVVFMLTPAAKSLLVLEEKMNAAGVTDVTAIMNDPAYVETSLKMLPFVLGGMLIFCVPVFYRLRFTDYILAEVPQMGALRAIMLSVHMTRKNCFALLKLDLRFWWFYLAQLLIAAIGFGEVILPLVGVELDMNGDAAMFVFYIAGLLCEFGLYVWRKNHVQATYALAYMQVKTELEQLAQPQGENY